LTVEPARRPFVSVVIVASGRREYLHRSVESARAQSAERSSYEIVVVKDFPDPEVDGLIADGTVVGVALHGGSVGLYLAQGVEAAHGDVVSFLDDDDAFLPSKVARVQEAFTSDPGLVYYHNGLEIRHDDDSRARGLLHSRSARDLVIDATRAPEHDVDYAFSRSLPINLSSVSVRRSLLLDGIDALRGITGATDFFCFYQALSARARLRFSSEPLSIYYVHASALRPQQLDDSAIGVFDRLCTAHIDVNSMGLRLPAPAGARNVAQSMLSEYEFLAGVLHPRSRGDLLRRFAKFVRASTSLRPRFVALATPILFGALLSRRVSLSILLIGRRIIQD
jgi:hypothetical protein